MRLEKIIAANLVYHMTVNNETQVELGRALGIAGSTVSNYVSGRGKPSLDVLFAIATHYGCTLDELCTFHIRLDVCPFCGASATFEQVADHVRIKVDHKNGCYLEGDNLIYKTKEEAADAWNTRA